MLFSFDDIMEYVEENERQNLSDLYFLIFSAV